MTRIIYLLFLVLISVAITKTFVKYQDLLNSGDAQISNALEERVEEKILYLKEKFAYLHKKSELLDKSVETNEKLLYLTQSDNFEEALFLIDYLSERFEELFLTEGEEQEVAAADVAFYLQRLDENLALVEADLNKIGGSPFKVSQR